MKTIDKLLDRSSLNCQTVEWIFPFILREKTKTAVLRVFLFISTSVRQFMLDVCVCLSVFREMSECLWECVCTCVRL